MRGTKFCGLAQLQTPSDLLNKLEHDLKRLRESPSDIYAAFDFFCTAEHMLDWKYPGKKNTTKRGEFRKSSPLLRLISHVANGSKHFVAEDPRHTSVKSVESESYFETEYVEPGYVADRIVIHLDEMNAEFGVNQIEVLELASLTLVFWKNDLLGVLHSP